MAIRNNEDRTGERRASAGEPPPIVAEQAETEAGANKTLDFTCPTEFVDLRRRANIMLMGTR